MGYTRYIAEFAPLKHWEDDDTKKGFIRVIYDNQIVLARPIFTHLSFDIPSKEFVERFRDYLRVIVEPLDNSPTKLGWSGFTFVDIPMGGVEEAYPYIKILKMDEEWLNAASTEKEKNFWVLRHTDQTFIKIDRKKDDESIVVEDGILKNTVTMNNKGITITDTFKNFLKMEESGITLQDNFGNKLVTTSSGILLQDKFGHKYEMASAGTTLDGEYIVLKKFTDWLQQNAPSIGMGNMGSPVPVFPSALAALNAGVVPGSQFLSNKPGSA